MARDDDLRDHQQMWSHFTKLLTWSAAAGAALLVFMALALL